MFLFTIIPGTLLAVNSLIVINMPSVLGGLGFIFDVASPCCRNAGKEKDHGR